MRGWESWNYSARRSESSWKLLTWHMNTWGRKIVKNMDPYSSQWSSKERQEAMDTMRIFTIFSVNNISLVPSVNLWIAICDPWLLLHSLALPTRVGLPHLCTFLSSMEGAMLLCHPLVCSSPDKTSPVSPELYPGIMSCEPFTTLLSL